MALQHVQAISILRHAIALGEGSSGLGVLSGGPPLSLFDLQGSPIHSSIKRTTHNLPVFRFFENCIYTLYFGNAPCLGLYLGLYLIDILCRAYWVQPFVFLLMKCSLKPK